MGMEVFLRLLINVLEEGLIYGIMAMGVYITYSVLSFPDLSVDGTFLLSYTAAVVFSPLAYPGYNWMAQAVSRVKEFYLLPVGKELLQYDTLAVNTIVKNRLGEVSSCDVPYSDDLARFNSDYLRLTKQVTESCENHDLTESMVIGTSAIIDTELDGAVGMNSGIFNNPFIIWGRYHRGLLKTTLTISFQFHHTQMDGAHAGSFLALVQENIRALRI